MAHTRPLPLIIFLFLFNITGIVSAQRENYVRGRLYDSRTGEGLAFATVHLEGHALGVISNEDGSFLIPLRFRELGGYLRISSMGYESRRIQVAALQPDVVNSIALSPGVFELSETVLHGKKTRNRSARNIVKTAIGRIPENYPDSPFGLIGYYRDYQRKSGGYINLNEAILEVYDPGFAGSDLENTRVRIYDYKPNDKFPKDSMASRPYDYQQWQKVITNAYLFNYGGNEFTILRMHDAIRNYRINTFSFVERLERDFVGNHSFKRQPDTRLGEEPLYTITFSSRKGYYRAEGTLLISRWDFAIHRMNYAVYDGTVAYPNGSKRYAGDKAGQLMFEVRTEYRRTGRELFLNYISFRNKFKLTIPPKFAIDSIAADIGCGCFQVYFNHMPTNQSALDLSHYQAMLNGKEMALARATVSGSTVVLYPPEDKKYMLKSLARYTGKAVSEPEAALSVQGVRDAQGNLVDVPEVIDMLQFREFFTQKVLGDAQLQADSLYMFRERPIFRDQPVAKPDNFDEYWMNTPLQEAN